MAPSIRKSWHYLLRQAAVARSVKLAHGLWLRSFFIYIICSKVQKSITFRAKEFPVFKLHEGSKGTWIYGLRFLECCTGLLHDLRVSSGHWSAGLTGPTAKSNVTDTQYICVPRNLFIQPLRWQLRAHPGSRLVCHLWLRSSFVQKNESVLLCYSFQWANGIDSVWKTKENGLNLSTA
jgi:hypothetical protein